MGIKYNREYEEIIDDMSEAIIGIDDLYDFIGMSGPDWKELSAQEKSECARTIADDIIYALGSDPVLNIGDSMVKYDRENGIVKVCSGKSCIRLIKLF